MPDKVRLYGSDILRVKCLSRPLEEIRSIIAEQYNLDGYLLNMHQTMVAEHGMGFAATQIGWTLPIFILKAENVRGYNEYINPEILSQEELVDFENEGCLSIPGVTFATKRFRKLTLRWEDRDGKTQESEFLDLPAFAVQHEMDHLNGKLYIDQLSMLKRSMVLGKFKKFLRERGR